MTTVLLALISSLYAVPLHLRFVSEGQPVVARVYVVNAAGESVKIPAISYVRRNETHSVVDGSIDLDLDPGTYRLRAEKGHEYGAAERTIQLSSEATVTLDIPRFYDMNARGWYSGDTHTHRSSEEMPLLARAEALNVAPNITRHVGAPRQVPGAFPANHLIRLDPAHLVTLQNQEVERLGDGHGAILLLNLPEAVNHVMQPIHPLDIEFCRRARQLGAFIDGEKPIWKNTPVLVALGAIDAIGIVNNHFHPNGMLLDAERYGSMERTKPEYKTIAGFAQWMMDLYYSFLNCGFRIPVSAGSASGVMPSWPGYERVYVKLDGPFSYEAWFRNLKAGHSIATNGPLLEASVNGKPPGLEMPVPKKKSIRVTIDARSQRPLERIEVVFNGVVLRTFAADGSVFHFDEDVRIPGAGWLAVRCFEPVTNTIRYAHTSPFYFTDRGRLPFNTSDAQRWARYVQMLAATATPDKYPTPEAHQNAQKTFTDAAAVYLKLK